MATGLVVVLCGGTVAGGTVLWPRSLSLVDGVNVYGMIARERWEAEGGVVGTVI